MPVIEDNADLDFLFQDVSDHKILKRRNAPRLPIGYAIARFNFVDPWNDTFGFSAGDRIAIYDEVDEILWLGGNTATNKAGQFPYLYVQLELQNIEAGVPAEERLEAITSINEKEVARVKQNFRRMFGNNLDPKTVFKVFHGMSDVKYWDLLHSFSMIHPTTAQWISVLILEIESFRKFTQRRWTYLYYATLSIWQYDFSLEGWPQGFKAVLYSGPKHVVWKPTLQYCRASVPTIVEMWRALKCELRQIADLDEYLNLDDLSDVVEDVVEMFRSNLAAMDKMDEEAKIAAEDPASSSTHLLSGGPSQTRPSDLENGAMTRPALAFLRRAQHAALMRWHQLLRAVGKPHGVFSTVISFALLGAAATAVATWKCSPPEKIPTVDSNFWSTLASAAIGTAGLFCTIIPILRNQQIEVGSPKLFHSLLWASLGLAVAATVVYLYQTRASLVLLFLSSAAQLATTLQIINGAVKKIRDDEVEISDLKARLGTP